jgi:hypothetical protein
MRYLCVFVPLALIPGCPLDANTDASSAGAAGTAAILRGDRWSAGGSASLDKLVDEAVKDRFPPAPPLSVLCMLQPGSMTFEGAKKLFETADKPSKYPGAKPQSESQDATMAGLAYRFSGPKMTASEAAPADDPQVASSVSLILRFTWSDGSPGTGTIIFGIGGSPEDLITGYVLQDMSITGMAYPGCWPHEEE